MPPIGTLEASKRWGYSRATVQKWCREGKIPGATQDKNDSSWHIPDDAECPRKVKKKDGEG